MLKTNDHKLSVGNIRSPRGKRSIFLKRLFAHKNTFVSVSMYFRFIIEQRVFDKKQIENHTLLKYISQEII